MRTLRRILVPVVYAALLFIPAIRAAEPVPAQLSDAVFWKLITDSSEAGGGFISENLVSNDSSTFSDIFVHDRQTRQTLIVSVTTGSFANGDSLWPSISADGRWVAFGTDASNLVTGDTNASGDILVRDMVSGTLELVSVSSSQVQANGLSEFPSISRDGRFVVFSSWATNLPPGGSGTYPAGTPGQTMTLPVRACPGMAPAPRTAPTMQGA